MNNSSTATILKSLADDTRLSIVRRLAQEQSEVASCNIVGDCANVLRLSQSTMSHHFARLVQAGVLSERKSGTEKFYTLNRALLAQTGIDPTKL